MVQKSYDAVIIGSGPNGLAAAITLAQAQRSVLVLEANEEFGGGLRSAELTLPGFTHDLCSTAHPMAQVSSFFRNLPLEAHGLKWAHPEAPLAHPFADGSVVLLERSVEATGDFLGPDKAAYARLMAPFVHDPLAFFDDALAPFHFPRHPVRMMGFGLKGLRSAAGLARSWFSGAAARGFFAGLAAHSILPLDQLLSAAVGLILGAAGHVAGWPVAKGGSSKIAAAMLSYLRSLGGEAESGRRIESFEQIPHARVVLFDTSPGPMSRICGERLPDRYRRRLSRFRHGPGIFKLDWALSEPIPWKEPLCGKAGTVHLGGTFEEIADSEKKAFSGELSDRPFVLLAQQSLCDPTRAPAGKHMAWAYCHVPRGSTVDRTACLEAQVERFAPGFRDVILARSAMNCADFERRNANYVGGDIAGGVVDLGQLFTRPVARWTPYSTPNPDIFLCSASTPPGPGVHGLCGYFAAKAALKRLACLYGSK